MKYLLLKLYRLYLNFQPFLLVQIHDFSNQISIKGLLIINLVVLSSGGFSAYNNNIAGNGWANRESTGQPMLVSQVVLSYKGEPLCQATASKNPELVPAFWEVGFAPNKRLDLPDCGLSELEQMYQMVGSAVLVDSVDEGIDVAGVHLMGLVRMLNTLTYCMSGAAIGIGSKWMMEGKNGPQGRDLVLGGLGIALLFHTGAFMAIMTPSGGPFSAVINGKAISNSVAVGSKALNYSTVGACAGLGYYAIHYWQD